MVPDAAGLPGWVNALSQSASRAQVVQGIEQSTEYRTKLVDTLYLQLLNRPADALRAVQEAVQLAESASRHDPASARARAEYDDARSALAELDSR